MSADLPIQMLDRPRRQCATDETHVAVLIRLPRDLLQVVDSFSRAGFRSRTAEIKMRLMASYANESIDEHGVIVVRSPSPCK